MFQKSVWACFLVSILVFAFALAPSAYAGKVELTTYYPSPYAEYTTLKSTTLDINGGSAPAVSPSGTGRIYFDSTANKFKASENGAAYANLSGSGGLVSVQVFTTTGTWTKPAGVSKVRVLLVAGGGGGGGGVASTNGGSGGSGGGYSEEIIDVTSVASVAVTVGGGGAGGAGGANGVAGTDSSFGAYLSATGGGRGNYAAASAAPGTGSGGNINLSGSRGSNLLGYTLGGSGGSSYFGGGGLGGSYNPAVAATAGLVPGSGGGGGMHTPVAGAAGAAGIVIVYEYT